MRICLATIHPRLLSGQLDSLAGLARLLRARGHEVAIVTPFTDDDVLDARRAFGPAAEGKTILPRLARLHQIWQTIAREGGAADVVHLNLPTPSFGVLANLVAARLRTPLIVGYEAHLPRSADLLRPSYLRDAARFYLPRLVVNNSALVRLAGFAADHYVVASQFQADELARLGLSTDRISTIPNLFDPARLSEDVGESPLTAIRRGPGPLLAYVGHFNHVKGVDVLVRAFPGVLARHPEARLVLAWSGLGDAGPVQRAINETGAADRIHLLGRVPVARLLAECDGCVLPYRLTIGQAAFPGLVLEAMAVGVPLVSSDLPLLRELLAPDDLAYLARPDDPTDLAAQINRLLDQPAAAQSMVTRQKRAIRSNLAPAILVRRYEDLYERVIAGAPARQASVLPAGERRRPVRSSAIR
jgi:glycosyltransferase involved in cell wall biosynthesis